MLEIKFEKYHNMGAYHWKDISKNLIKHNAGVNQRYKIIIDLLKEFNCNRMSKLLDVGCGDGALTGKIYKKFYCDITAIDNTDLGIELAQEMFDKFNYKAKFKIISDYKFPVDDNLFDFVVCTEVIEHVQYPDKLLLEIFRTLKKNGILILTTPIKLYEHPADKMHVKEWYQEEFKAFCNNVLQIKPIKTIYSHPVFWNDLYAMNSKLFHPIRLIMNTLDILGLNLFYNKNKKRWSTYSLQILIFKK